MKLPEFRELCEKEWRNGHGDITTLWLTADSTVELFTDVMLDGGQDIIFPGIEPSELDLIAGGKLTQIANPVTKTAVRIRDAEDGPDAVDIYDGKKHFSRILGEWPHG